MLVVAWPQHPNPTIACPRLERGGHCQRWGCCMVMGAAAAGLDAALHQLQGMAAGKELSTIAPLRKPCSWGTWSSFSPVGTQAPITSVCCTVLWCQWRYLRPEPCPPQVSTSAEPQSYSPWRQARARAGSGQKPGSCSATHGYPILKAQSNALALLSRRLEQVGSHSLMEGVSRALCLAWMLWAGGISH